MREIWHVCSECYASYTAHIRVGFYGPKGGESLAIARIIVTIRVLASSVYIDILKETVVGQ